MPMEKYCSGRTSSFMPGQVQKRISLPEKAPRQGHKGKKTAEKDWLQKARHHSAHEKNGAKASSGAAQGTPHPGTAPPQT